MLEMSAVGNFVDLSAVSAEVCAGRCSCTGLQVLLSCFRWSHSILPSTQRTSEIRAPG